MEVKNKLIDSLYSQVASELGASVVYVGMINRGERKPKRPGSKGYRVLQRLKELAGEGSEPAKTTAP